MNTKVSRMGILNYASKCVVFYDAWNKINGIVISVIAQAADMASPHKIMP